MALQRQVTEGRARLQDPWGDALRRNRDTLKFCTIRSYMYLSTLRQDGRALFDALVRFTEGRSWLARNG